MKHDELLNLINKNLEKINETQQLNLLLLSLKDTDDLLYEEIRKEISDRTFNEIENLKNKKIEGLLEKLMENIK